MEYTAAQIQSFRDELAVLQDALTKLQSGRLPGKMVIDGDVVEYHQVDIPRLERRVENLKSIVSTVDNPGEYATSFKIFSGKGL